MKDRYWKIAMVGDFMDCWSCDEPCGHVWFVSMAFDTKTNRPVSINTRNTEAGVQLVPEESYTWTPKANARDAAKRRAEAFAKAAQGPLYKLKDFCKGGAFEKDIAEENVRAAEFFVDLGLAREVAEVPEKILWPDMSK